MSENINYPFLWQVVQSLVLGLVTIVTFARKPGEDATAALNEMKDRVIRLEEAVKHMPSSEDLNALSGDVREVRANLNGLVESQKAQSLLLNRIDDFLRRTK